MGNNSQDRYLQEMFKRRVFGFFEGNRAGAKCITVTKRYCRKAKRGGFKVFLSDAEHAEFLVQIYLQKGQSDNKYRIPKELTNENKEELVIAYIKSDAPNLNYLRLIMQETNSSKLKLKPSTKIMARQKI